jgi:hypothetical protein
MGRRLLTHLLVLAATVGAFVPHGTNRPPRHVPLRTSRATSDASPTGGPSGEPPPLLASSSALTLPRLHRATLRQHALRGLEELSLTSSAALERERVAIVSGDGRITLLPALVAAASLWHARVGLRVAFMIFAVSRLASAMVVGQPDAHELIPAQTAARAALRSTTLALEAGGLLSLACLLAGCSACAACELGARAAIVRAESAVRHGRDNPELPGLRDALNDAIASAKSLRVADAWESARSLAVDVGQRGSRTIRRQLSGALLGANASVAPTNATAAPAAAPAAPSNATAAPADDATAVPAVAPRPASSVHTVQRRLLGGIGGGIGGPVLDRKADAAAEAAEAAGVRWCAPSTVASLELVGLMRQAAMQSALHTLLALAAALWALEAAFLLSLALGQRAQLALAAAVSAARERAVPATRQVLSDLPRSTEEAAQQVNYQLNLIGLQAEQWMTDRWSVYLRKRRQWMRGSQGKAAASGPSWGGSIGQWWDERVASVNQGWVSFQISNAKAQAGKGKGAKDAKGAKDVQGPKSAKGAKDAKGPKGAKDAKDAKGVKVTRAAGAPSKAAKPAGEVEHEAEGPSVRAGDTQKAPPKEHRHGLFSRRSWSGHHTPRPAAPSEAVDAPMPSEGDDGTDEELLQEGGKEDGSTDGEKASPSRWYHLGRLRGHGSSTSASDTPKHASTDSQKDGDGSPPADIDAAGAA